MARSKSAARIVLVSLAVVLVAAIVGVVVLASIDQRALTERVVERVVAAASQSMGREVTFDEARGRVLPDPRVTITGLAVAGRPGEPALVETDELRVELRLWPLLRSLGREIEIREVAAVRPELHLIRDAEGAWNFEGLGGTGEEPVPEVSIAQLSAVDGTVQVIDRSAPGSSETAVALTHVDVAAELPEGELTRLELRGAFANDEQNLDVELAIGPEGSRPGVARAADESATAASATQFPPVSGSVALRDAELARLGGLLPAGISSFLRGGRVNLEAEVETDEKGIYELSGNAQLSGVRLRGGEPARGAMRVVARVDPKAPAAFRADIGRASLTGPGVELTGSGAFTGKPRSVTFDVRGPRLDLDLLLAALPEQEQQPQRDRAMLPPSLRRAVEETTARGTIRIDRVVHGELTLDDVVARAQLRGGVLELEQGEAKLYGGSIVTSGTRADLRPAVPPWTLHARLEGVDLGAMMQQTAGDRALVGTLGGNLDVSGVGAAWELVQSSADGSGVVQLRDGVLTTGDIGSEAIGVVGQALQLVGRESATVEEVGTGQTELGDVRVAFRVDEGSVVLQQPVAVDAPFGGARIDGRIGLDRSLDLTGTVMLSPDFVDEIASVRPAAAIEVPLTIGGTLQDPAIAMGSPEALASQLTRSLVQEGAQRLQEELGEQLGEELGEPVEEGLRDLQRHLPIPGF